MARENVKSYVPFNLPNVALRSKIGNSPYAVRQAEAMSAAAQCDVDSLLAQLSKGNANPGKGNKPLGNGFYELRGANGDRVIVKQTGLNSYDIVGKFQRSHPWRRGKLDYHYATYQWLFRVIAS